MANANSSLLYTDRILPVIDQRRAVKKPWELAAIKYGAQILERVFAWVRFCAVTGRTEQQVAQDIARVMKRNGAEALAFPVIVASGPGTSDIHHFPTKRRVRKGDILMIDCGAVVKGYCSDCTRTFFIGHPSQRFIRYYQEVLKAQERAIVKIRHGITAKSVDRAARGYLARWRWGKTFTHGCGHGVGLAIHEFPNLKPKSRDALKAGMVVTVEPGIYLKRWGGIRIEDMVLVRRGGRDIITRSIPKQLEQIILS
ncbi:MAG: M24 family metallopeptidase [Patescibacteria group bacterium]